MAKYSAVFARNLPFVNSGGPFRTKLDPQTEDEFQTWAKQNGVPSNAGGKPDPMFSSTENDYDMRGYYQALKGGDVNAIQSKINGHYPDTYKTPCHEGFSNESIYATPNAPKWDGNTLKDQTSGLVFKKE